MDEVGFGAFATRTTDIETFDFNAGLMIGGRHEWPRKRRTSAKAR